MYDSTEMHRAATPDAHVNQRRRRTTTTTRMTTPPQARAQTYHARGGACEGCTVADSLADLFVGAGADSAVSAPDRFPYTPAQLSAAGVVARQS